MPPREARQLRRSHEKSGRMARVYTGAIKFEGISKFRAPGLAPAQPAIHQFSLRLRPPGIRAGGPRDISEKARVLNHSTAAVAGLRRWGPLATNGGPT